MKLFYFLSLTIIINFFAINSVFANQAKKPNIILIYTDQQRYDTISSLGNEQIITPNLDRLVNNGVAFTQSFVNVPVCLSSRSSLFSGMYTTSNKFYSNHHYGKRPETNLALALKESGYNTALVGKNHTFLDERDMDTIVHTPKFPENPKDGRSAFKSNKWDRSQDPMVHLTDKTMEILARNKNQPNFIWLSYLHPHTPYIVQEPYFSMYNNVHIPEPVVEVNGLNEANKPFRQIFHKENNDRLLYYNKEKIMRTKRTYYGMITMIDEEIGRLLTFLEQENLLENTLIVFTSDHGDYMGDHGLVTKSPAMYDSLTRVPLIWSWGDTLAKNVISDELISNVDIMPTILSMLNLELPKQLQGIDFSEYLKDPSTGGNLRNYVFAEYGIPGKPMSRERLEKVMPDYRNKAITFRNPQVPWEANPISLAGRFRMIRNKNWKFVQEVGGTNELYNLQEDPNELINLSGNPKYRFIEKRLEIDLNQWKSNLIGVEADMSNLSEKNINKYLKRKS